MLSKKDVDRIADAVAKRLAPPAVSLDGGPIAVKLSAMVDKYITGMDGTRRR